MNFGCYLKMCIIRKYFYWFGGILIYDGLFFIFWYVSFGYSVVSWSEVGLIFVLNECENLFFVDEFFLGYFKCMGFFLIDVEIWFFGLLVGGDVKFVEVFMLFLEY